MPFLLVLHVHGPLNLGFDLKRGFYMVQILWSDFYLNWLFKSIKRLIFRIRRIQPSIFRNMIDRLLRFWPAYSLKPNRGRLVRMIRLIHLISFWFDFKFIRINIWIQIFILALIWVVLELIINIWLLQIDGIRWIYITFFDVYK